MWIEIPEFLRFRIVLKVRFRSKLFVLCTSVNGQVYLENGMFRRFEYVFVFQF